MSTRVFELDQAQNKILDAIEWTDEEIDISERESLFKELDRVKGDAMGYLKWQSTLLAQAVYTAEVQRGVADTMRKAYEKQLKKAQSYENNEGRIRESMLNNMKMFKFKKVQGDYVNVSLSTRIDVVVTDRVDPAKLPAGIAKQEWKIDKRELKARLLAKFKESGLSIDEFKSGVEGLLVVENDSITVL